MEILFWQWHSFMGKGIERALHRLGVAYDTFFYQMNDWEKDDRFAEQLEKKIQQQDYDVVFSINFNPIISDVCQNHKLPYRAWVYDSPIHIRNTKALKNSYTKVYFFDRGQAEEYRRQGIAFHTLDLLINDAKKQGVLQIALEATDMGRPLYERYGFVKMEDKMELKV